MTVFSEDIKRLQRGRVNMTDRSSCQQKGPGAIVFCQPVDRRQRRTLRAPPAHSPPLRDRLPSYPWSKPPFFDIPGKNDLANDPLQGRSLLKQANHREKPNVL